MAADIPRPDKWVDALVDLANSGGGEEMTSFLVADIERERESEARRFVALTCLEIVGGMLASVDPQHRPRGSKAWLRRAKRVIKSDAEYQDMKRRDAEEHDAGPTG